MLDFRTCGLCFIPDGLCIDGDLSPPVDDESFFEDFFFDDLSASFLVSDIESGEEDVSDGKFSFSGISPHSFDVLREEFAWYLEMDSGPVSCFSVCIDGSPMPEGFEGFDGH